MRKNRMKFGKGVKKYADGGSTEMEDLEEVTVTSRKKPYSYEQKYNFPSRGGLNAGMGAGMAAVLPMRLDTLDVLS